MALDFQKIREQVRTIGEQATQHVKELEELYIRAWELLEEEPEAVTELRQKVERTVEEFDSNLRCGVPLEDSLSSSYPQREELTDGTLIAVDGSQIIPDQHAEINFGLINLGAVIMDKGDPGPPRIRINSQILYENQLYTETGMISDLQFSLLRDLNERRWLVELAAETQAPVIALTDGPIELWGARRGEGWRDFKQSLEEYKQVLSYLEKLDVTVCGYVDNPAANLVTRFMEIGLIEENQLSNIRREHPLRGVKDRILFGNVLNSGERSGVFRMQSRSTRDYQKGLAPHFFYLNVGREGNPLVARVEIPAWVALREDKLDKIQAVLVGQCRILGDRPYPYLLHRAHAHLMDADAVLKDALERAGGSLEGHEHHHHHHNSPE